MSSNDPRYRRYYRISAKNLLSEPWPVGEVKEAVFARPKSRTAEPNIHMKAIRSVAIVPGRVNEPYPAPGHCIYCKANRYDDADTRPLGEEHIINEGIGGTLGIRQASCGACEKYTSGPESRIINEALNAARFHLGTRMKGTKKKNPRFRATKIARQFEEIERLPLADHPTMLMLITLAAPGILMGRRSDARAGPYGGWTKNLNLDVERLRQRGYDGLASPEFDTVSFCQMLAKIAHSFAYAELGQDLVPMLPRLIRRKLPPKVSAWPSRYHLIGGNPFERPESDALHELDLGIETTTGQGYVVVRIRLFAKYDAPTYYVVAGRLR